MEPADRLAAFLADELSADERRALEAELARDARLRAELDAMRRGDEALAGLAPTALPDGARDRLLAALEPTFDAELGAAPGSVRSGDELAARRRASARRSWITAIGGVAAVVAAIAIIGPSLGGLGSGDGADSAGDTAMTAEEDTGAAAESADGEAESGLLAAPVGPTLIGSERALDEESAAGLLAAEELDAVVDQGLSVDDAAALGGSWAVAFGASPEAAASSLRDRSGDAADDSATSGGEAAPSEEAQTESSDEDVPATAAEPAGPLYGALQPADLQILGDVDDDARADVGRCLGELLGAGGVYVPALAELVTFAGEPAIAYGLVGVDPDGSVTRREVWIVARESCETRYWRQG